MRVAEKYGKSAIKSADNIISEAGSKVVKALETGGDVGREAGKAVRSAESAVSAGGLRLSTKADDAADALKTADFYAGPKGVARSLDEYDAFVEGSNKTIAKPNHGQGFSPKGYNPQPGERTLKGYVEQNANPEVVLYTKSAGFNNAKGNAGGQFKRVGAGAHYGLSPHVHQPIRDVVPNGTIFGKVGKTVGVDTLSPSKIKVLNSYMSILIMENIINRRIFMTQEQINFFEELAYIQEYCVNAPLSREDKYCNTEELLKDVTCEVIYRIMELLDGYGGGLQRCNIVNTVTGEIINKDIELHDKCVEFLENPYSANK